MKFNCKTCNYSTDVKYCYQKHLNTKKHTEKVDEENKEAQAKLELNQILTVRNEYQCPYCENLYNSQQSLSRHKKTCTVNKDIEKEKDILIKELQDKLSCKDDIIKTKDDVIKTKDDNLKTKNLKTMLNCAGTLVEKSMSNLSYLNKHYPNAPALEYITDISDISDLHEDLKEDQVVDNIIYEYKNHTLTSFIGDMIVKNYKKTDPTQQSLWNSDNDRLTYMIRSLLANESIRWEVDKKGINTTKYIIKPITDYIKKQLENYIITCEVSRKDKTRKLMGSVYKMADCRIIIANINDGTVADNILKYISPHLYIVKETQELV